MACSAESTCSPDFTRVPLAGGFDDSLFVNPPSPSQGYHCPVCLLVLKEPHLLSCCGKHFCEACIENVKSSGQDCPCCRKPDFNTLLNKEKRARVLELKVRCSNSKSGCDWTGELGDKTRHLETRCPFVEEACQYECGGMYPRRVLQVHQRDKCVNRPIEVKLESFMRLSSERMNALERELAQVKLELKEKEKQWEAGYTYQKSQTLPELAMKEEISKRGEHTVFVKKEINHPTDSQSPYALDKLMIRDIPNGVDEELLLTYLEGRFHLDVDVDFSVQIRGSCALVTFQRQYSDDELEVMIQSVEKKKLRGQSLSADRCHHCSEMAASTRRDTFVCQDGLKLCSINPRSGAGEDAGADGGKTSPQDLQDLHKQKGPERLMYSRDFLLSYRKRAKRPPPCLQDIPMVLLLQTQEEMIIQALLKKFQKLVDKLTPQNLNDCAAKVQTLQINSEKKLIGCVDIIYEKALENSQFSAIYSSLCQVMPDIKVSVSKVNEEGEQVVVKETSFRRELLTKCQKEFEKLDEEREAKLQAIEEASSGKKKKKELKKREAISRRRSLGNIWFMGELFKVNILSESIIHECIMRLLHSSSDQESLECFCRLITTTGKELDHPQAKMRMDRYFVRIADIIDKKKISSRIRFMLQDVQDLRKSDWVPRRQEGLKTIDQIHQEAETKVVDEQKNGTMKIGSGDDCPLDMSDLATAPPPQHHGGRRRRNKKLSKSSLI